MQKITPFLWFDGKAEEAANFYVSIFKNSKIGKVNRYGEHGPGPKGTVMIATFQIDGQDFIALNGGPQFKFTPAISFVVNCETQEEVDDFWEKLSQGGTKLQCGWLQDKFGVSWQIVPTALAKLMSDPDREKTSRVMQALMQMTKIDIQQVASRLFSTSKRVCLNCKNSGEMTMRFMMIVKANKDSEAGKMPSEELLTAMGKYNEELMKAGVLVDLSGLAGQLEGRARQVLGRETNGDRRAVRRDEGTDRGLLGHQCEIERRGD